MIFSKFNNNNICDMIALINWAFVLLKCYGTLDWITSEGHTAVVRYAFELKFNVT